MVCATHFIRSNFWKMKLTPSGVILLGALALCLTSKGQDSKIGYLTTSDWYTGNEWQRALDSAHTHDEHVMMKIVLLNKTSIHFFRQGYKRGEKYWYIDGKRVKPLPKNWMVWEYKIIKP